MMVLGLGDLGGDLVGFSDETDVFRMKRSFSCRLDTDSRAFGVFWARGIGRSLCSRRFLRFSEGGLYQNAGSGILRMFSSTCLNAFAYGYDCENEILMRRTLTRTSAPILNSLSRIVPHCARS